MHMSLVEMAGYGREYALERMKPGFKGRELLYDLFICCCVTLGKPFNISEPRFPHLLSEKFGANDPQDHTSSNI